MLYPWLKFIPFGILFYFLFTNTATVTGKPGNKLLEQLSETAHGKIIGGRLADPHEYPWLVQIRQSDMHWCGGFIFDEKTVVTAAHCISKPGMSPKFFHVVTGEHDTRCTEGLEYTRKVVDYRLHYNFEPGPYLNDVALFKVEPPFVYNKYVQKANLVAADFSYPETAEVAGWGRLGQNSPRPAKLLTAKLTRVTDAECRNSRHAGFDERYIICYGNGLAEPSGCRGDSGGPLHCIGDNKVYVCGIVSLGNGCGRQNIPSTFTKLSKYIRWIEKHAKIKGPIIDPLLLKQLMKTRPGSNKTWDIIIDLHPKPKILPPLPSHLPLAQRGEILRQSLKHQVDKYQVPVVRALHGLHGKPASSVQRVRSSNEIFAWGANKELILAVAEDENLAITSIRETYTVFPADPDEVSHTKKSSKPRPRSKVRADNDDDELEPQANMEAIGINLWWDAGYNGTGIVVGIIDSGVRYDHGLFYNNWLGKVIPHRRAWHDPRDNKPLPFDQSNHGTHVLGIAVGRWGYGAAPGAKWVACYDPADEAYTKLCMEWMMCQTLNDEEPCITPHVTVNSWGTHLGLRQINHDAIIAGWRAIGIISVFSAGNTFYLEGCGSVTGPGDHPDVITVGNMDTNQPTYVLEGGSGRGPSNWSSLNIIKPDLVAPGTEIQSAVADKDVDGGDEYGWNSGASMATPHVAGAVAVLLSRYQNLSFQEARQFLIDNTLTKGFGEPPKPHCGPTPPSVFPNNEYGHGFLHLPDPKNLAQVGKVSPSLLASIHSRQGNNLAMWEVVIELTPKPTRVTGVPDTSVSTRATYIRSELIKQSRLAQIAVIDYIQNHGTPPGLPKPRLIELWLTNEIIVKNASAKLILDVAKESKLPTVQIRNPTVFNRTVLQGYNEPLEDDIDEDGIPLAFSRLGVPDWWKAGYRGASKIVGHIDTGVNMNHPMLKDNIHVNQKRGWFDPFNLRDEPYDYSKTGVGTHTISVILGNDRGFVPIKGNVRYGVARDSKWSSCAACEDTYCLDTTIKTCVQFMLCTVIDESETCVAPNIVYNNWGFLQGTLNFHEILYPWIDAGIVPVFAAGDYAEFTGCGSVKHPGDNSEVITVGAISFQNVTQSRRYKLAPFSGLGPSLLQSIKPNIVAPGVSIKAASRSGGYKYMGGTAVAAAHVAGTFAVIMSREPTWVLRDFLCKVKVYRNRTAAIREGMDKPCGKITDPTVWPNNEFGYGMLQLPKPDEDILCP